MRLWIFRQGGRMRACEIWIERLTGGTNQLQLIP